MSYKICALPKTPEIQKKPRVNAYRSLVIIYAVRGSSGGSWFLPRSLGTSGCATCADLNKIHRFDFLCLNFLSFKKSVEVRTLYFVSHLFKLWAVRLKLVTPRA